MLLLIDGSSMLSTCFFATIPKEYFSAQSPEHQKAILNRVMQTKDGTHINGVYGMSKTLIGLLKNQNPSHLAVCWDVSRETFRKRIYPAYKANRAGAIPELVKQYDIMQQFLKRIGVAQYWRKGYEADDLLGSIARKYEQKLPIYILTKDQDALQLVSEKTKLWLYTKKVQEKCKEAGVNQSGLPNQVFEYTPMLVERLHGLLPEQIPDLKGLEGDSSDNIPGVEGVGAKTAVALLKKFGSIEKLYEFVGLNKDNPKIFLEIGIKRVPFDKLLAGESNALLSKKLATIKTDLDIPDLGFMRTKVRWGLLNEALDKLNFQSLKEKKLFRTVQLCMF